MRFNLKKEFFSDREFVLCQTADFKVTAFKYSTGVEAIKVENQKGYFIILPYQGQQIWRVNFLGKDLVMKTKFSEPAPTLEYLRTYGGFLLHCGINAFGVPGSEDDHVQHGEIPNVCYDGAYIEVNEEYASVGGSYNFNRSFVKNYTFSPECRLYKDETVLKLNMELENRRDEEMEYMYLCHINFCPIEGAELMYSAPYDKDHVKVHKIVPDSLPQEKKEKLKKYMDDVQENIPLHHKVNKEAQCYQPEICFTVMYKGDGENRAYTLQKAVDGACYVNHPVDVLPYAIRWISRTGDEDSMGMVLPATAEHFGYTYAKKNGQMKTLPPYGKLNFSIEAGWIDSKKASEIEEKIKKING